MQRSDMGRALFFSVLVGLLTFATGDVCEGKFKLQVLEQCEDQDKYPVQFEVIKRKINRTHDGFSLKVSFNEDFTPDYQIRVESYEKCDGGYKASDIISGYMCSLLNEYCKENFQEVLGLAGVEPQDCPIAKGEFEIRNYVVNYNRLPKQSKCGEFKWIAYVIKDNKEVSCMTAYGTFTKAEDDE